MAHATHVHADWCLTPHALRLSAALHSRAVQRCPCLHAGIGNTRAGLHPVQERLARAHGSQCGFCTPGFVMSMYALLRSRPAPPSEQDIEENLAGNLWCGPGRLVEPLLSLQEVEATSSRCKHERCLARPALRSMAMHTSVCVSMPVQTNVAALQPLHRLPPDPGRVQGVRQGGAARVHRGGHRGQQGPGKPWTQRARGGA